MPLGLALRDKNNWPELYFGLYFAGLIFQLWHLDWIRSGDGSTSLSGPRAVQWLAQGVILAVIWPLIMVPGRAFIHRVHLPVAVSLSILWVAFEFGRKHAWAIVDSTGYPYGQLGLTQADLPRLIQLADVGGIYAVTGLVAAVNGLVVDVIGWLMARRKGDCARPPLAVTAAVGVAVATAWLYGAWRVSQGPAQAGPMACLMPASTATALEPVEPGLRQDDGGMSEAITTSGLRSDHGRPLRPELLIWSEAAGTSFAAKPIEATEIAVAAPIGADSGHENVEPALTSETTANMTAVDCMERFSSRINAALVVGADRQLEHVGAALLQFSRRDRSATGVYRLLR